jgi:hypothetical protein
MCLKIGDSVVVSSLANYFGKVDKFYKNLDMIEVVTENSRGIFCSILCNDWKIRKLILLCA